MAVFALAAAVIATGINHRWPRLLRSRSKPAIWLCAGAAAVGAALAPAAPTGLRALDIAYRLLAAGLVTLAAARSRRWSWLVASGLAVAGIPLGWAGLAAAASLGTAAAATFLDRRGRVMAAVISALAVQGLLRLTWPTPTGVTTAMAIVGGGALAFSGIRRMRSRQRRMVLLAMLGGVGAAVVACALAGASMLQARTSAAQAVDTAETGLQTAEGGHVEQGAQQLGQAATTFATAHRRLDAWWARAGLAIPVLAQNQRALIRLAGEGEQVARQATAVARAVNPRDLAVSGGTIHLSAVEALPGVLAPADAAVASARQTLADVASPWLAGALSDRVGRFAGKLDRVDHDEQLLLRAADTLPTLLGSTTPRRYLLAVLDTSELRGGGGTVADFGVVTASDGHISLQQVQAVPPYLSHVTPVSEPEATWAADLSYPQLANFPIDADFAPDFPSDARVMEQIFQPLGVGAVDGVIGVDPVALAGFLQLTGPVSVPSWPVPITSANAEQIFLHDQYLSLTGTARQNFLADASRAIFERITSMDLPDPATLGQALGTAIQTGHLLVYSNDPTGQALSDAVGLAGAMSPAPPGGDFLEVVNENGGSNKIDWYLHRQISYDVTYNPESGQTSAVLTVRLRNDAPAGGEPPYILGGGLGQPAPTGVNLSEIEIYSQLGLSSATVDGRALTASRFAVGSYNLISTFVQIPPGGAITVDIRLVGSLGPGVYRLALGRQPAVRPDRIDLSVVRTGGGKPNQLSCPSWAATSGSRCTGSLLTPAPVTARFS